MEPITDKEARLLISQLQTQIASVQQQLGTVQQTVAVLPPVIPVPTPQAVNQIRNGTYSHSVGSWDNDATADDRRYECAWWFSHPLTTAQPMFKNTTTSGNCTLTFTNANVNTGADTITIANHWLDTGMGVKFTTGGTLPAPLVAGTTYFVYRVDASTIKLGVSSADLQRVTPIFIDLTTTGAGTSTLHFNYTVKEATHTYYSSGVTNWNWATGSARPHGLWSLDALIPGNNIDPGYSFYAIFDCVRISQYVTAAAGTRIFAGIYHHSTLAGWEFIQAPFDITDTVVGTVSTPTSRDYLVETITDRGFTVSSSVLTEANAPSNTDFGNGARVVLSWKNVLNFGVQTYRIYRNTGGTYRLLKEITTGITTYIDNNSFVSAAGGYPSTDFSSLIAYTSTIPDVLGTIPFAGDPLNPLWATVPFAIKIPQNYNKSDSILADGQWLRWGLTAGLDYSIPGCTATFGSSDILAPSGAAIASLVGKSCDVISASFGTQSGTVSSVVGDTIGIFPASVSIGHGTFDVTVYVYEGGEDGMYVDLAHLSYVAGAAFSPNAEDISPSRGIPPVTPNGTTQGGSGQGGGGSGGDGDPVCLFEEEMVKGANGRILAKDLRKGIPLPDGYGRYNTVTEVKLGVSDIWYLETEKGVTLKCTDTKQIYTAKHKKKVVKHLKTNDTVLVEIDGALVPDKITLKEKIMTRQIVVQIGLKPGHSFLAGDGKGWMLVSNLKPIEGILT